MEAKAKRPGSRITRVRDRKTDPTALCGGPYVMAAGINDGRGAADAERRQLNEHHLAGQ